MRKMMNYNPYSLENKTVLVTGASSGIGRATAIESSKLGAKVIITARNEERLKRTMSELDGNDNVMILADLNIENDIDSLVEKVGIIDCMSFNAGISCIKPVLFYDKNDLSSVFQTNTISAVTLTKALIKRKKIGKSASLVYTSSIEGVFGTGIGNGIYGMSKTALSAFVKTAALELASRGIRCNTVNPGMVKTPLITSGEFSTEQLENDSKKYPLGRYGNPDEIAWAIIYLMSNAASWITGTELKIDGGITLL